MANLLPVIETLEHRWMRAWVGRDARDLKSLTSGEFRFVTGSQPCVILDATSWLQAATTRYLCTSYRFGDIYVHALDGTAVFATQLTLEARLDGADWSRQVWVTDVWRKDPDQAQLAPRRPRLLPTGREAGSACRNSFAATLAISSTKKHLAEPAAQRPLLPAAAVTVLAFQGRPR